VTVTNRLKRGRELSRPRFHIVIRARKEKGKVSSEKSGCILPFSAAGKSCRECSYRAVRRNSGKCLHDSNHSAVGVTPSISNFERLHGGALPGWPGTALEWQAKKIVRSKCFGQPSPYLHPIRCSLLFPYDHSPSRGRFHPDPILPDGRTAFIHDADILTIARTVRIE